MVLSSIDFVLFPVRNILSVMGTFDHLTVPWYLTHPSGQCAIFELQTGTHIHLSNAPIPSPVPYLLPEIWHVCRWKDSFLLLLQSTYLREAVTAVLPMQCSKDKFLRGLDVLRQRSDAFRVVSVAWGWGVRCDLDTLRCVYSTVLNRSARFSRLPERQPWKQWC